MQPWECGTCWYQSRNVPFVGLASELRHHTVFLLANTEILFGFTVCRKIPIFIHLGLFLGEKKVECHFIIVSMEISNIKVLEENLSWFWNCVKIQIMIKRNGCCEELTCCHRHFIMDLYLLRVLNLCLLTVLSTNFSF